jgi:hypothetical protein
MPEFHVCLFGIGDSVLNGEADRKAYKFFCDTRGIACRQASRKLELSGGARFVLRADKGESTEKCRIG